MLSVTAGGSQNVTLSTTDGDATADEDVLVDAVSAAGAQVTITATGAIDSLAGVADSRGLFNPAGRAFLFTGVLGAFTTFSTFSIETLTLIEQAELLKAGLNMLLSVSACIVACWFGLVIGRQL